MISNAATKARTTSVQTGVLRVTPNTLSRQAKRMSSAAPRDALSTARSSFPFIHFLLPKRGVASGAATAEVPTTTTNQPTSRPLRVLIAGGGIGGLVLAVALLKKGIQVEVFERDVTAIRGEGKYRGPIQVQSNALAALEAIDPAVAEEVLQEGCITGDRINGMCDGVSGDWYVKFNTFHPAAERGLPVTRVISRVSLQGILAEAVARYGNPIHANSHVVSFEENVDAATKQRTVSVKLEDGRTFEGDLLIGADGIWSKIRKEIVGETKANFSGYTCYTGISDFMPADIDVVGYRVFLGNGRYFVSSDVGGGKMQWYGFHKEAAGGTDKEGTRKQRLLNIFGDWCDNVTDLIKATPEADVLRRDIFDRPPIFTWAKGHVALLGDSAHAMQPNLGQGGCMAIEDAFELATLLYDKHDAVQGNVASMNIEQLLRDYQAARLVRVSAIHGMAGMAAMMASTYKAYLGEGLGPLSWITKFKIPHPGRVVGQLIMVLTMPMVLDWVLGGNVQNLVKGRAPAFRLSDMPKAFKESMLHTFMTSDDEILHTMKADWMLVHTVSPSMKVMLGEEQAQIEGTKAVAYKRGLDYFLQDKGTQGGVFVNGSQVASGVEVQLKPSDLVEFGAIGSKNAFKVKLQHISVSQEVRAQQLATI